MAPGSLKYGASGPIGRKMPTNMINAGHDHERGRRMALYKRKLGHAYHVHDLDVHLCANLLGQPSLGDQGQYVFCAGVQ